VDVHGTTGVVGIAIPNGWNEMAVNLRVAERRDARESEEHYGNGSAVLALEAALRRALELRASDVHFEPLPQAAGRLRFRVDGVLEAGDEIPAGTFALVCSRLKLLAGLDIANRRLPQDGRFHIIIDATPLDARVATLPSFDGEKLTVRIARPTDHLPQLGELGMEAGMLSAYREAITAPWGVVLIAGPTGSGKTTTAYASLCALDLATRNVCTVEDPIEMRIAGTLQVQVSDKAGLTFANVLRAFVRHDPDVLMIGELRDRDSVNVGISAALSGRSIIATIHSADTLRTIDRLLEFGASRHSLGMSLRAILAQRLVRRLCRLCATSAPVAARWSSVLPFARVGIPQGCRACADTGYAGRIPLFELLLWNDELGAALSDRDLALSATRKRMFRDVQTFRNDAIEKLAAGLTSLAEAERVLGGLVA
jgi:type II secretory ATPase GspE/PulE/Tfp pilus assembly ATPase PilB-like protein